MIRSLRNWIARRRFKRLLERYPVNVKPVDPPWRETLYDRVKRQEADEFWAHVLQKDPIPVDHSYIAAYTDDSAIEPDEYLPPTPGVHSTIGGD